MVVFSDWQITAHGCEHAALSGPGGDASSTKNFCGTRGARAVTIITILLIASID